MSREVCKLCGEVKDIAEVIPTSNPEVKAPVCMPCIDTLANTIAEQVDAVIRGKPLPAPNHAEARAAMSDAAIGAGWVKQDDSGKIGATGLHPTEDGDSSSSSDR